MQSDHVQDLEILFVGPECTMGVCAIVKPSTAGAKLPIRCIWTVFKASELSIDSFHLETTL